MLISLKELQYVREQTLFTHDMAMLGFSTVPYHRVVRNFVRKQSAKFHTKMFYRSGEKRDFVKTCWTKNPNSGSMCLRFSLRWLPRVITNIVLTERELQNETQLISLKVFPRGDLPAWVLVVNFRIKAVTMATSHLMTGTYFPHFDVKATLKLGLRAPLAIVTRKKKQS